VDIPIADKSEIDGCLSGKTIPRFTMDDPTRKTILGYQRIARNEPYPSPFAARQQMLERAGCVRCHQRDTDRVPPLEALSSKLGGAYMQYVPFQRTPRLTYPHQKYLRSYLVTAVRESVSGLRPSRYSFRMPAFGHDAETLVQALAEADGELPATADPPPVAPADPTLATLTGPHLVGFQGYACVSCHVWDGKLLSESDPGAIGTDLTRVKGRIRRDWFERFLEDPARSHPGTPMPGIFPKGKPAMLASILDGDPARQKESLWSYFALGKNAPSPKPPPPLPVTVPARGEPPIVAQVPVRLPKGGSIESICLLSADHDLIVYDVGAMTLHSGWTGANLLRGVHGRIRSFSVAGTMIGTGYRADPPWQLAGAEKPETPSATTLHGYDLLDDGASVRWRMEFPSVAIEVVESLRIATADGKRHLRRDLQFRGIPAGRSVELRCRELDSPAIDRAAKVMGEVKLSTDGGIYRATVSPSVSGAASFVLQHILGPPGTPPPIERTILADPGRVEGSLERPGYRAIVYPRPKTAAGDDLIMPVSLAVHPRDGRVFVGSMKLGEIFVLRDPTGDGKQARFDNYARGLFQEAYSMLAEDDALYVLHRRNLTKITETGGAARRFDRIFAVPHGISESYDYGYGLVRDRSGAFVFSFAPYANTTLPGSGGALRLVPGKPPQEIAFGFRNPIGWSTGPEGEIFFTDNQGEWVATNKLCHLVEGRFYGFPNAAQRHHASKPMAKTAVWVPYAWARSINGVTYDHTAGKFGPFAGQFFLAELMYGGAIVRAQLEKVNGEYQGACFPFWGKGLLGPLVLAFDPKGPLYVGSITEPGWMAQPDRGALYRIDYTGQVPFEMQSIHVRPRGFRIVFTSPVSPGTAGDPASYQIEHYRYEYTGAYGSPELDRARLAIERVEVSADGKSVEVTTAPLTRNRVYMIEPRGVRSANGESLVHPVGAYTLNEIPAR
jgi:glucose/arabinose dehydrogenase